MCVCTGRNDSLAEPGHHHVRVPFPCVHLRVYICVLTFVFVWATGEGLQGRRKRRRCSIGQTAQQAGGGMLANISQVTRQRR